MPCCYKHQKNTWAITKIPDKLWNKISGILPKEKSKDTICLRPILPFRKVLDGILYILRTGCQWWKMLPS